jgi:hypothetical protein
MLLATMEARLAQPRTMGPAKSAKPLHRLRLSMKRCLGTLEVLAARALGVLASSWMRFEGTPEDAKFRDTPPTNMLTQ